MWSSLRAKVQQQQAQGVPKPPSAGSKDFLCPMGFTESHPLQNKHPGSNLQHRLPLH